VNDVFLEKTSVMPSWGGEWQRGRGVFETEREHTVEQTYLSYSAPTRP